jgi:nitrogen regulatory protein PII
MKEIIAVIRNEKWQATRMALEGLDIEQLIHRRVLGRGRQQGLRYLRRGSDSGEGGMSFRASEWSRA